MINIIYILIAHDIMFLLSILCINKNLMYGKLENRILIQSALFIQLSKY